MEFTQAVDAVERGHTNRIEVDFKALQQVEEKYGKDFLKKMMGSARTSE